MVHLIQSELDEDAIIQTDKPHPLLRPRSLAPNPEGDTNQDTIEEEKTPRVKPQFGLPPSELSDRFPDEPVPGILVACIEILEKGK